MIFSKLNGLGNDFVITDDRENKYTENLDEMARKLCHRRTGIGADGLVFVRKSETCDVRMQIFNSDGSEAEMCGMEVSLAYPEGYEVMDDVVELAKKQSAESGGSLTVSHDMKEAFRDADIVYPKSWAPFKAMEERTELYGNGDLEGIKALERRLLAQNANHKDWECTEEMMKLTKGGKALYLHCLPADITGVSCEAGEVAASVFDRYRDPLYKQASFKPYIIAAMIFLAKVKDPAAKLLELEARGTLRHNG